MYAFAKSRIWLFNGLKQFSANFQTSAKISLGITRTPAQYSDKFLPVGELVNDIAIEIASARIRSENFSQKVVVCV